MASANSVAFKVFLTQKDGNDTRNEVRRFFIDRDVAVNYRYLCAKLENVFPMLRHDSYSVSWIDDDGDKVTISSDEEMMMGLANMKDDLMKVHVSCNQNFKEIPMEIPLLLTETTSTSSRKRPCDTQQHVGVVCDSCEGPVNGYRYKCITCEDYDLCPTCESKNLHPEHLMIRIPFPIGPSARFSKHVGYSVHKSLNKCGSFIVNKSDVDNHFKKHRKERHSSGDKKDEGKHSGKHGEHREGRGKWRHEGHSSSHEPRSGNRCSGSRNTWFNTFAAYMNEFANLAGDLNPENQNTPSPTTQANTAAPESASQAKANTTTSAAPGTGNGENIPTNRTTDYNYLNEMNMKYLQSVGKTVAKILDPFGIDVDFEVRPKNKSNGQTEPSAPVDSGSVSETTATAPSAEPAPVPEGNIIDLDNEPTSARSERESSSDSSDSNERNEDWTLLNTEESSQERDNASRVDPKKIGFDLDRMAQEFRKHLELHTQSMGSAPSTSTSVQTSGIYPNIHLEMDEIPMDVGIEETNITVEAAANPVQQPTPATVPAPVAAPASPAAQPTPPSHIPSSPLEVMLAMGFKNEGGRLARLLAAKNGDISAVLDVLSMNIPWCCP